MLRLATMDRVELALMLHHYGLTLRLTAPNENIPGSYWGESEAGLKGDVLYARLDTPVHSVLHEASHYICMTPERRSGLDRDAGGDDAEESAVCYLQILLADALPEVGRLRMMQDMDEWGYSFRLGSTRAWLDGDAEDTRHWLLVHGLIRADGTLSGEVRV
ncbi:MAG TPA: hypothetical protein VGV09_12510 [Steroidobacteraceae bacterium]|nr:hypothetical protein [Steroidobacteraceae bacterium]